MYYTQQRSSITHYYGTIIIGGNRTTCQLMQGNCAVTRSTAPTLLRGDDDDYNAMMRIDCAHTVTHIHTVIHTPTSNDTRTGLIASLTISRLGLTDDTLITVSYTHLTLPTILRV